MKKTRRLTIMLILGVVLAATAFAGKPRKLPIGAYISQAKIEILSGDLERYKTAIAMLDSLQINYGYHAEALAWRWKIYVDFMKKASTAEEKRKEVEAIVAYMDTLRMTCELKEINGQKINSKYKKDCSKYITEADSNAVFYWRQFYNAGVEQLKEIRTVGEDMEADPDSASQEFYRGKLNAFADSCEMSLGLAILFDSTDHRPYVGLASIHEQQKEWDEANEILILALARTKHIEDSSSILLQVAYNYVNASEYEASITYLAKYCNIVPEDTANLLNLSSLYNRAGMFDSSLTTYYRILDLDPGNIDALTGIGRYFNQMAITASDSSRVSEGAGDEAAKVVWREKRNIAFDSSKAYFARAYELAPDTVFVAEEYGVICYLTEDFKAAIGPFSRLTELEPQVTDHWTSLGDCYLQTAQWDKAARAYEKVVAVEPENRLIWESLEALYQQLKEPENLKKAQEHLK